MWKRFIPYALIAIIGLGVGIGAANYYAKGAADKRTQQLTTDLVECQDLNRRLSAQFALAKADSIRIAESNVAIRADYNRLTKQFSAIRDGLGKVGTGLDNISTDISSAGEGVDKINAGLEQLKEIARLLP